MYTLDELKVLASENPVNIEWEKVDESPDGRLELEEAFANAEKNATKMEQIYTKLTSGESDLPFNDIEKYIPLVADELLAIYTLQNARQVYRAVLEVTA